MNTQYVQYNAEKDFIAELQQLKAQDNHTKNGKVVWYS